VSPITGSCRVAQGNATGALLPEQYIQSLFAAAADGLLRSPASLLSLAAPGAAAAAVPAAACAPGSGPAQRATPAQDGSGGGLAAASPVLTQVPSWQRAAAAGHRVQFSRSQSNAKAGHHTVLPVLRGPSLLLQKQLAQLLDLSEDDEEDVYVLGGASPALPLRSFAGGLATPDPTAGNHGHGASGGGGGGGSSDAAIEGGQGHNAADSPAAGARSPKKRNRRPRKRQQQHDQVGCRFAGRQLLTSMRQQQYISKSAERNQILKRPGSGSVVCLPF
jgi:hypothetical protein